MLGNLSIDTRHTLYKFNDSYISSLLVLHSLLFNELYPNWLCHLLPISHPTHLSIKIHNSEDINLIVLVYCNWLRYVCFGKEL